VDNIYQHGRKFTAAEIIQRATGGPMSIDPYIAYLKAKYGELYSL
jgi:carboxypeptidase Taq